MVSLWNMDEVIYWDNTSAFVWNNIAALPTITEGEKVIDLLNCWVFAWLRACFRAYFLLLCIHSPSTAIANHWNRFCGSLSHSDLWCSWQESYFRAHRNPEVEKEAIRIGLNHTHILGCSVRQFHWLILVCTYGAHAIPLSTTVFETVKTTAVVHRFSHLLC